MASHDSNKHTAHHPNPATALARVVVDEMAAAGVALMVISPGSRSGALAIAAAEHPDLNTRVFIDERSAAFHALGAARAGGSPVAVLSTSGSAPAHFFPAIIEADMACVPLIAVSADRPGELRGVGANQTIDQEDLFGDKVRGYSGIEAPEPGVDSNAEWRAIVAGVVTRSMQPIPGPVHLNVAFREPTVPVSDDGRTRSAPYRFATPRLPGASPIPETALPAEPALEVSTDRAVLIAGDGRYDRPALMEEAARLGWPVLATALSGLRGASVVSSYRGLLADGVPERLLPEVVVAIGSTGPDPSLERLFAVAGQRVRVDWWGRHIDPGRNATERHVADPVRLLTGVGHEADPSWAASWHQADRECDQRLMETISAETRVTGAGVARVLNHLDWGALVVASSLPIREVDAHLRRAGPVFANRGASGIDGFVSTSLGVAATVPRTLAVCGDLSLLHDANGFLHDGEIDLTLIVIDNGGGGLFDSLPQAKYAPQYERLFVTDPRRDLEALARFHGARVERIEDLSALLRSAGQALLRPGVDVLVVPVDRRQDLEMRVQLFG